MKYMLLTEVVEETSTEITNGFSVTAPQLRLIILAVIVLAICAYFILKPTEERKSTAKNYLNSLATNIMGIVLANIDFRVNSFTGKIETNFDDFKQSLVDEIYKDRKKVFGIGGEHLVTLPEIKAIARYRNCML